MTYLKTEFCGAQEDMIFEESGRRYFIGAGLAEYVAGGGELTARDIANLIAQHRYHRECRQDVTEDQVKAVIAAAVAVVRSKREQVENPACP